jgi:hypothetical protein
MAMPPPRAFTRPRFFSEIVSAWSKVPAQAVERRFLVHRFEHVQEARDGLVVGGVEAEGPAVFDQQTHHRFQLFFHGRRQLRAALAEVLEVGPGGHQVFAPALQRVALSSSLSSWCSRSTRAIHLP